MDHYSTRIFLIALVVFYLSSFGEGKRKPNEAPFYTVEKTINQDGTVRILVNGRGVKDNTPYFKGEDSTIYIGNSKVVVGDKIFGKDIDHLYFFDNKNNCWDYSFEEDDDDAWRLYNNQCDRIKKERDEAREYLFPLTFKEKYEIKSFMVTRKETKSFISYRIIGNGVVDTAVFTKNQDTKIYKNTGSVLNIGNRFFTDEKNTLYRAANGLCIKRKYSLGRQSDGKVLSDLECTELQKKIYASSGMTPPPPPKHVSTMDKLKLLFQG